VESEIVKLSLLRMNTEYGKLVKAGEKFPNTKSLLEGSEDMCDLFPRSMRHTECTNTYKCKSNNLLKRTLSIEEGFYHLQDASQVLDG
jgi:hypothetical protein